MMITLSYTFVMRTKRIFHIINKYQNPGILAIIRIFDPILYESYINNCPNIEYYYIMGSLTTLRSPSSVISIPIIFKILLASASLSLSTMFLAMCSLYFGIQCCPILYLPRRSVGTTFKTATSLTDPIFEERDS